MQYLCRVTHCAASSPPRVLWFPVRKNPYITNASRSISYPQGHLKFDGGAGSGVPERKALSQRHVLLCQQHAQRHRQISQRAFVLVIFYLRALRVKEEG